MKTMTRREAIERGEKYYFTGNPCPKGHIANRFTSRAWCVECANEQASSAAKKKYDKSYYQENKERISDRGREYYKENRERVLETCASWSERNRAKVLEIKRNYKCRRRAQEEGGISSKDLAEWRDSQEKVCFWCDAECENNFHIDHFYPLSRGGAHEAENLVIACATCNLRKSNKMPDVFMEEILAGEVSRATVRPRVAEAA